MELSKIAFYPNSDPTASFNLYVWTGPDAANQILSQPVGNYIVDEWNEVTLSSPVLIDASQEFWFGYSVTHIPGMWPAGCDDGPAIQGKGDMISTGGAWSSLYVLTGGLLDCNWNLTGYVETTEKKGPAKPMVKTVIEPVLSSFVSSKESGKTGNVQKKFIPNKNKALLGYNVYKNSVIIGFTTNTYYLDENIGLGTFEYYITALYDEGVSVPSNSVWIVGTEPCGPPVNVAAAVVYLNDIEVTWEPPLTGTPLGYNLFRDNTLIDYTTALSYVEPNVGPGTFNYCVSTVCLEGESEMACADPVTINYFAPPINLIAMVNDNFINLAWDPPNATGLLGYNVYHSYENGTFNLLTFTEFTYYIMAEVPTGLHSFCVTAIYIEGGSDCSNIVEVLITSMGENNIGGLDVYPNPSKDEVNVSSGSIIKSISIFNSFGQLMKNQNVNDKNFRFNISKFNPGVYVLKIEFSDGLISKRIVIE